MNKQIKPKQVRSIFYYIYTIHLFTSSNPTLILTRVIRFSTGLGFWQKRQRKVAERKEDKLQASMGNSKPSGRPLRAAAQTKTYKEQSDSDHQSSQSESEKPPPPKACVHLQYFCSALVIILYSRVKICIIILSRCLPNRKRHWGDQRRSSQLQPQDEDKRSRRALGPKNKAR